MENFELYEGFEEVEEIVTAVSNGSLNCCT